MQAPEPPFGVVSPLTKHNTIGFDFETHLITPGNLTPRAVCLSLAGYGEPPGWLLDLKNASTMGLHLDASGGVWTALVLRDVLADAFLALMESDVVKVAHNAAYDLAVGAVALSEARGAGVGVRAVFDALERGTVAGTDIREKLLDIGFGAMRGKRYGLDAVVLRRFGEDISGDKKDPTAWRTRYHELDGVPLPWPTKAVRYAIEDARYALNVALDQAGTPGVETTTGDGSTLVRADGSIVNEVEQVRAQFVLHLMAVWGVRTDAAFIDTWEQELRDGMKAGRDAGVEAGFAVRKGDKVGKKMKPLYERVAQAYEAQGRDRSEFYTGSMLGKGENAVPRVKTDHDTLMESGDPALIAWAESNFADKMVNEWIPRLRVGTDYAMTSSPSVLVATGRCAWRNPPLHQPPRKGRMRQCIKARDGYVMASCDWNSAELVALAQIKIWMFGHCPLADAINDGLDPHLAFAANLMGIPHHEAAALRLKGDAEVKSMRQFAKVANFGFPGGLGPNGFVGYAKSMAGLVIPKYPDAENHPGVLSAQELYDGWREKWDMGPYLDHFSEAAGASEHGFTYPQWVSGRLRGGVGYTDGCNTGFQGLVADAAKTAAWMVSRACYLPDGGYDAEGRPDGTRSALYGARPWLLLHDEILAEVPEATAHEAGMELQRLMVLALRFYTPDVAVGAETALSRRWHKAAEPVFKNGRLVCWDDLTSS